MKHLIPLQQRFNRRQLVGGIASTVAGSLLLTDSMVTSYSQKQVQSGLPEGIEVRDIRLLPSADVMRFLIEVHNTTDTSIDTPTIGVVIPHQNSENNFGWAVPFQGVLHSHSSSGLVGIAPGVVTSDEQWSAAKWYICNDMQTEMARHVKSWGIEFEQEITVKSPGNIWIDLLITNTGEDFPSDITLSGLVRDARGRIAGGTLSLYLNSIKSGTAKNLSLQILPELRYAANPMPLIASSTDLSVDFSIQPYKPSDFAPGCPPLMPWIR